MQQQPPFLPFADFIRSLGKRAAYRVIQQHPSRQATDAMAEEMRTFLLKYYRNTHAVHSYMDREGIIWDCFPEDNQPGIARKKRAADVIVPPYPGEGGGVPETFELQEASQKDRFGNDLQCGPGYIPVKRLTLESLLQLDNLAVLNKKQLGSSGLEEDITAMNLAAVDNRHRYAYSRQLAPNRGGGATLSLWQPAIAPGNGQLFSLSQIWVVAGRGNELQTVEVGWQVCPKLWGTDKPVLFTYWTADNYQTTGTYNQQGNAFVLKNNKYRLGGAVSPVSVVDGPQVEMIMEYFLLNNAWWLYINKEAVGYYPISLFRGGALSGGSDALQMGGEVSGDNAWGPMGSGMFPEQRLGKSAYIRNARIMAMNGTQFDCTLSPFATSPNCYRITTGDDPAWGASFFYGGPGGGNC